MYEFYEAKYAYDAKKRMEAGDCGVRHPPQSHSGETHNRLCAVIAFYTMQAKDREVRLKQAAVWVTIELEMIFAPLTHIYRRTCWNTRRQKHSVSSDVGVPCLRSISK
jgi:hypothetical protein